MKPLRWGTEIIEKKGWYWLDTGVGGPLIVRVVCDEWGYLCVLGHCQPFVRVSDLSGRWAGPIPQPVD